MKFPITILFIFCLILLWCAEKPEHTNIFDPKTPNEAPGGVRLSPDLISYITHNSITFSWTESGDADFFKYKIYRSEKPGVDTQSTLIVEYNYPFLTTITDTSLQANSPYYYAVYTEDKGGRMTPSNELRVRTTPDIYALAQMTDDGNVSITGFLGKMDVVRHDDYVYVAVATVTREYNLLLFTRRNPVNDIYDRLYKTEIPLLTGDFDNDGEPDLYEIFAGTDPDDPEDFPQISYTDYTPISPIQTVVIEDTISPLSVLFVSFGWSRPYFSTKILKFTGDYNSEIYKLDRSWHENGVLNIGYPKPGAMKAYSSSQIIVADTENNLTFFNVHDNGQNNISVHSGVFDLSIGRDHPDGPKLIYLLSSENVVKLNEQGDILNSWQGITNTGFWLASVGLYADNYGNVFVIDPDLSTINHFTSQGEFVSRWYQTSSPDFQYPFLFQDVMNPYGQVSIDGDGENFVFFVDQTPSLYCSQL